MSMQHNKFSLLYELIHWDDNIFLKYDKQGVLKYRIFHKNK